MSAALSSSSPDAVPTPTPPVTPARSRFDVRLAIAIVIGNLLWIAPFIAGISVLVPARLEVIAPDQKVAVIATLATTGSVVALVANIVFGALSDRTRSRLGRRAPWMILGSLACAVCFWAISAVGSVVALVLLWCTFQFFLNAIVAPLIAIIPDRVPEARRGTFSAIYGVGSTLGGGLAGIVASRFVSDPRAGLVVFGIAIALAGPLVALIAPDRSNRDDPRSPFTRATILHQFSFPRHGARDFYLALTGKLFFVLALYTVTGYQLYILTDHYGLGMAAAGGIIATVAAIQTIGSLVSGSLAGPLSDRLGRRKAPVVGAALLLALALAVLFLWHDSNAMIVFAVLGLGLAFGVFNSVDQALNYSVLPDPDVAAKDLGILNMANTGGQILGPLVMALAISSLGGYGAGFAISAVIALLSAGTIAMIRGAR
ncbi:MFS transporter [Brachybacterium sp. J144]|uniref:MFS transporter n=1 Tax=Brachybacterium sp. J144 TaxID=3116487 RepID=UPI002E78F4D2|nr:MFS transporter [Brachybacterium sp. J144]MEE1651425.1 MFS transporter [Brachybacterium sp. J144]